MSSTTNEAPAKRRIELIKVEPEEEITNPTKKIKLEGASLNDVKPEGAENNFFNFSLYSNPKTPKETGINELFLKYISVFVTSLKKYNKTEDKKLELLLTVIKQLKAEYPEFLGFSTFSMLLQEHYQSVKAAKNADLIIDYHFNLIMELKRYATRTPNPSTSAIPLAEKESKIHMLTKRIVELRSTISKLETKDLTLDDMAHDTYFTKLGKLKNSLIKLWRKRENLNNYSTTVIGQHAFKKFSYNKTGNAQINLLVEKYFSSCMQKLREREDKAIYRTTMPVKFDDLNVIDFRDFLNREIKKAKIDYTISERELIEIFEDLVRERNHRRWYDLNDSFMTLIESSELEPESLPNEDDEEFKKSFEKNRAIADAALEKVFDKFVAIDEQNKQFVNPQYLGEDDVGENDLDLDDDDEENDEDDDEEEEAKEADIETDNNVSTDNSTTGSDVKGDSCKTDLDNAIVEDIKDENGNESDLITIDDP